MTLRIAGFLAVRTTDDDGTDIGRYTNFRAVIPLDENRRYLSPGGQVTVRIEADDAHIDDADKNSYLFEAVISGAHVDDNPSDILTGALDVLAAEGFELAGVGWTQTGDRFVAGVAAIAEKAGEVAKVVEQLTASTYKRVAEHTLYLPKAAVDAAIAQGLVRVVRVQETLARPGGERMLAAVA